MLNIYDLLLLWNALDKSIQLMAYVMWEEKHHLLCWNRGGYWHVCLDMLVFPLVSKWPFPACSVIFGSLMAVWCCLKSGCCSFCWVIRKIVWWKDIWEGERKLGTLTLPSLTHVYCILPFSIRFLPRSPSRSLHWAVCVRSKRVKK